MMYHDCSVLLYCGLSDGLEDLKTDGRCFHIFHIYRLLSCGGCLVHLKVRAPYETLPTLHPL